MFGLGGFLSAVLKDFEVEEAACSWGSGHGRYGSVPVKSVSICSCI